MDKGYVIAIDGPVAAGKGTIAPKLAEKLEGFYLYTGAMYRSLALAAIRSGISLEDEDSLSSLASSLNISLHDQKVLLNGEDVVGELTREDVASGSSKVAVIKQVREHMVKKQQDIAKQYIDQGKVVVAEGRDTATKIFPNAEFKIYLTASPEIRAQRRLEQLNAKGIDKTFEKVLSEVKERDKRDLERKVDPLISEPEKFGYFVLDNSELTEEETVEKIINKIKASNND